MNIVPFVSVDEIKFGDSEADVLRLCGEPIRRTRIDEQIVDLFYGGFAVAFDARGVIDITMWRRSKPTLHGSQLFEIDNIFRVLQKYDSSPIVRLGFMYYLEIGLWIPEDFYDDDDDEYGSNPVGVVRRGHLEEVLFRKGAPPRPSQQ